MSVVTEPNLTKQKEIFAKSSNAISIGTIALVIDQVLKYISLGKEYIIPKNSLQEKVLMYYEQIAPSLERILADPNVDAKADASHLVLNAFLKEHGFSIELDPFGAGGFGVVGLFRAKGKHQKQGSKKTIVDITGKEHARLGAEFRDFDIDTTTNTAISFSEDGMYMLLFTPVDEYYEGLDLFAKSFDILRNPNKNIVSSRTQYDGVVIPSIDFDESADIKDLVIGMSMGNFHVDQALQQNQFKFNEKGFEAASATAFGMRGVSFQPPKNLLVFDGPMIATFATNYLGSENVPLLSVMVNQDSWKYPSIGL